MGVCLLFPWPLALAPVVALPLSSPPSSALLGGPAPRSPRMQFLLLGPLGLGVVTPSFAAGPPGAPAFSGRTSRSEHEKLYASSACNDLRLLQLEKRRV